MQAVLMTLPTLAVSTVYCLWNIYRSAYCQRSRRLRERVAYMLWVMATEIDSSPRPSAILRRAETGGRVPDG